MHAEETVTILPCEQMFLIYPQDLFDLAYL